MRLCNAAALAMALDARPRALLCASMVDTSWRIGVPCREVQVLKIGIVGLGQVGKTTLFRILTHAHGSALTSGKPEAHLGVVHVPDARLDRLVKMHPGRKTVYASVEYVDSPGSVIDLLRTGLQTASLREIDALAHVVRAFEDEALPPPGGSLNPQRDIENVELEMILSDLAVIEKRLERLERDLKKQKNPALEAEHHVLLTCKAALEKQTPLREVALGAEEALVRGFMFLSLKPMLYVLNLSEKDAARAQAAEEFAAEAGLKQRPRTGVAAVSGKIEAELAELNDADAAEFLASFGLAESAVARVIKASYQLLGVISFFTIGENECRAWTIRSGATAWEAAGEVHSDFQKGFIRAEVVKFEDLVGAGSLAEARSRGLVKLEGKEYVLHDGEVVYIRHSP
jgi:GTP-binding protein YchF